MSTIKEPRFYTFEEWLALHPEVKDEPCPHCDGKTSHERDCGNVHGCAYCYGNGVSPSKKLKYLEAKKRDMEKWNHWFGKTLTQEQTQCST